MESFLFNFKNCKCYCTVVESKKKIIIYLFVLIVYYNMYRMNGRTQKVSDKCRKLFLKRKYTIFENELSKSVYDFKTFKNRTRVPQKLQKTIFLNRTQTRLS